MLAHLLQFSSLKVLGPSSPNCLNSSLKPSPDVVCTSTFQVILTGTQVCQNFTIRGRNKFPATITSLATPPSPQQLLLLDRNTLSNGICIVSQIYATSMLFFSFNKYFLSIYNVSGKDLGQGLANYGPQAKFGPPPVSVNQVLLEHSHAPLLIYFYGCFQAITTELSSCDRDNYVL